MARDVGIEPTSRGLESLVLPLDESRICLECLVRIELTIGVLQTPALPLGYRHILNYLELPDS